MEKDLLSAVSACGFGDESGSCFSWIFFKFGEFFYNSYVSNIAKLQSLASRRPSPAKSLPSDRPT